MVELNLAGPYTACPHKQAQPAIPLLPAPHEPPPSDDQRTSSKRDLEPPLPGGSRWARSEERCSEAGDTRGF